MIAAGVRGRSSAHCCSARVVAGGRASAFRPDNPADDPPDQHPRCRRSVGEPATGRQSVAGSQPTVRPTQQGLRPVRREGVAVAGYGEAFVRGGIRAGAAQAGGYAALGRQVGSALVRGISGAIAGFSVGKAVAQSGGTRSSNCSAWAVQPLPLQRWADRSPVLWRASPEAWASSWVGSPGTRTRACECQPADRSTAQGRRGRHPAGRRTTLPETERHGRCGGDRGHPA